MEGRDESVSMAMRRVLVTLPGAAYSAMYTPAITPMGTEIRRERTTRYTVLKNWFPMPLGPKEKISGFMALIPPHTT